MILVTGANGFVGAAIARSLIADGRETRGLVRRSSELERLEGLNPPLRYADIGDWRALKGTLEDVETIVHCAAMASDWGSRAEFHRVNVGGVESLVEAARRSGTVRRIIHLSTANVAGEGSRDAAENDVSRERLRFDYSRSKLDAEAAAEKLCADHGIELTILRPAAVYGPGDRKWSYRMIEAIARGRWPLVSGGRALFAPLYIDNLCRAVALAIDREEAGGVWNITDGIAVSWREFSGMIADHLGVNRRFRSVPYALAFPGGAMMEMVYRLPLLRGEPKLTRYRIIKAGRDFHYSIDRAREELGYQPDTNLDGHLLKTVEWFRSLQP
ncbi:NAD-dependent epimerase/dehydratase family protein [Gemmatimonadota bacterium]